MENKKKKGCNILITISAICALVVVGLCCFQLGTTYGKKETTSSKKPEVTSNSNSNAGEDKEVPEEVVEELKEIIGYETSGDQFLHRAFIGANGVIDQLDSDFKVAILDFATADSRKDIPVAFDENCIEMGSCPGIPITAIENAAKKYGITNPTKFFDESETFVKSGDYYVWLGSGYGIASSIESSNFKASYQGEDIIIEEDLTETYSDETEEQGKYHISYTFKKNSEGDYYLYSVTSKDA